MKNNYCKLYVQECMGCYCTVCMDPFRCPHRTKLYEYDDWDFDVIDPECASIPENRIYIDSECKPITGILEDYYYFTKNDPRNNKYIEDGMVKD